MCSLQQSHSHFLLPAASPAIPALTDFHLKWTDKKIHILSLTYCIRSWSSLNEPREEQKPGLPFGAHRSTQLSSAVGLWAPMGCRVPVCCRGLEQAAFTAPFPALTILWFYGSLSILVSSDSCAHVYFLLCVSKNMITLTYIYFHVYTEIIPALHSNSQCDTWRNPDKRLSMLPEDTACLLPPRHSSLITSCSFSWQESLPCISMCHHEEWGKEDSLPFPGKEENNLHININADKWIYSNPHFCHWWQSWRARLNPKQTSHEVQMGGGRGQETAGKTKQIASLRSK